MQDQIEAGLVEIHLLNNLLHPIPHPAPVYLEVRPQVIVADDDGMEVDGPAVAAPPLHEDVEDEELRMERRSSTLTRTTSLECSG